MNADGLNNLSDAGSSLVSVLGFRWANKPADKDHPFGHARVEYIMGFVIAFIVLFLRKRKKSVRSSPPVAPRYYQRFADSGEWTGNRLNQKSFPCPFQRRDI